LSAQLSVREGLADKMSRPSLGGVVTVPCEELAEGGCADGDAVVCGGAFFGEGDDDSVSDVGGGGVGS
jgi:hypothetical protein